MKVNESTKLIGLIEDISRRLQRLETSGVKKKHFNNKPSANSREHSPTFSDVNTKPFVPSVSQKQDNRQGVFSVDQKVPRPTALPLDRQQNNASELIHKDNAQAAITTKLSVMKRICREPCAYYLN